MTALHTLKQKSQTMTETPRVEILDHPLAGGYLAKLRDKNSTSETFRLQAARLSEMLVLQATQNLKTVNETIETPLTTTQEEVINETIGIVPILRAGIGMVEPFLTFLPDANVLYLGLFRDETTHQPISYYNKINDTYSADTIFVIDPMLATGGSAILAIDEIKKKNVKKVVFVGLIGAPEGVKALHDKHPDVDIYLAALDDHLNENAYIVPGLGDAGDRIFNSF